MNNRRRLILPVVALCAAVGVSCGPTEQAQTVSFVLSTSSKRLSQIEFVVSYESGKFTEQDGACVVSSAAGPRSFAITEAKLIEKDKLRMMSRPERRAHAKAVRGAAQLGASRILAGGELQGTADVPSQAVRGRVVVPLADTTTSTTSMTSSTTSMPVTTTTMDGPTTTAAPTTTLPPGPVDCGNSVVDDGEQCDDGNDSSGDGCDGNCQAEFSFSAVDDDNGALTIRITNGLGIAPGAALAFCKFQGDVDSAELGISTTSCGRPNGGVCTPTSDAIVGLSTTTTTTTTTTSSTTTTTGGADTTVTSSTEEPDN